MRHYPRSPIQNGGISTETKPWSVLWKLDRKFHDFVSEEFPEEFPQKAQGLVFVAIPQKVLDRFVSGFLDTTQYAEPPEQGTYLKIWRELRH